MAFNRRFCSLIFRRFIESESAGGLLLMGCALLALIVANSPWQQAYTDVLGAYIGGLSVLHWINDGLMAVFFLLVGLEIKRELLIGQLATTSNRILPGLAALGGMVMPAVVYAAIVRNGSAEELRGWAIPAATDIAFALGVLSLLGSCVPLSLKVFLTALAIIDDLGAVILIALFYTADLNIEALAGAGAVVFLLAILNTMRVTSLIPYLVLGAGLWFLVLNSGVHATLAGVALALAIPLTDGTRSTDQPPLLRLEHAIQPWVAFAVVPIFGFANAGVSFAGMSLASLLAPVPLGVVAGLFVGKQIGVFGTVALAQRLGWVALPADVSRAQLYGISLLCGIGFTMSLFIGLLAFPSSPDLQDQVKFGVLIGSIFSGILGFAVLSFAGRSGPLD